MEPLTLIDNPGSSSRKYGLYTGETQRASLYFEHNEGRYVCNVSVDGKEREFPVDISGVSESTSHVLPILRDAGVLQENEKVMRVGMRIVAPSDYFLEDHLIDEDVIKRLEALKPRALIHITATLEEVRLMKQNFPDAKIIGISDSAFHASKPDYAWQYGLPLEDANRLEVKRYGYHGISLASGVYLLEKEHKLLARMVVCHLGSGASVTAIRDGESIDTSMGYSPLEGLVMATRSGSIDPIAVSVLRDSLGFDNNAMEEYLNTKCGLLGLSGTSSEIPQLLEAETNGDRRAHLAMETYIHTVRKTIGQMVAALDGVDGLVFTGTVGERAVTVRQRIAEGLDYLNLVINPDTNKQCERPVKITTISQPHSRPIFVVPTDEADEMCRRVKAFFTDSPGLYPEPTTDQ
jgi:acetate kinase